MKTPLRVTDPGTDKTLPSGGSLSYGAIASPGGLAGGSGIDGKLVHGDRWQTIDQNQTTMITGNDILSITGNQTVTISTNHTLTIVGNVVSTVIGAHNLLQVGAQNQIHVDPHCRLDSSPECQTEPTNKMRLFGVEFEVKSTENTITGNKIEIVGTGLEINGFTEEITGMNMEMKVIDYCLVPAVALEQKIISLEVEPFYAHTFGAEVDAGAGEAKVVPTVNAVPHAPTMGG
ncbi:MAG TPA: hypothetical protein VMB25_15430 [Bryobacteraceae bacterium]|nr:hypothetical protein [Bryobacteraceae bacterium]